MKSPARARRATEPAVSVVVATHNRRARLGALLDSLRRQTLDRFEVIVVVEGPTHDFETANVFYPRALLERLGGFDERYPRPAGEDCDLGWRAQERGANRVYVPEAAVEHAVIELTPLGMMRKLWTWSYVMRCYADHPQLRERLY